MTRGETRGRSFKDPTSILVLFVYRTKALKERKEEEEKLVE